MRDQTTNPVQVDEQNNIRVEKLHFSSIIFQYH